MRFIYGRLSRPTTSSGEVGYRANAKRPHSVTAETSFLIAIGLPKVAGFAVLRRFFSAFSIACALFRLDAGLSQVEPEFLERGFD